MENPPGADRFTEARVLAAAALRSTWWSSAKIAATVLLGSFAALGAALQGLGAVGQAGAINGWYFISLCIPAGLGSFVALELRHLADKASALRALHEAQREYEALLADARAERNAEHARAEGLLVQNEQIRTTAYLVGLFRSAVGEQKDE